LDSEDELRLNLQMGEAALTSVAIVKNREGWQEEVVNVLRRCGQGKELRNGGWKSKDELNIWWWETGPGM